MFQSQTDAFEKKQFRAIAMSLFKETAPPHHFSYRELVADGPFIRPAAMLI
jgi:hypothetical protein